MLGLQVHIEPVPHLEVHAAVAADVVPRRVLDMLCQGTQRIHMPVASPTVVHMSVGHSQMLLQRPGTGEAPVAYLAIPHCGDDYCSRKVKVGLAAMRR